MSERLKNARKELENIYKDNDLQVVMEVMTIVNKYADISSQKLLEYDVDELQADTVKLCAMNFYLMTLTSNLEANYVVASNKRKYQEANIWTNVKEQSGKMTNGEVSKRAEVGLIAYRHNEADALRKYKIVEAATKAVIEVVNALKKTVERILWQGPSKQV